MACADQEAYHQQMMPKQANKVFSAESTQYMHLESYNTAVLDLQTKYVAASLVTDTQNNYHNPRACTEG